MVNVGSVGQPRDGDRRACYVILDDEYIHFNRVEYPAEVTRDKIYAIPDLDKQSGRSFVAGTLIQVGSSPTNMRAWPAFFYWQTKHILAP